jgi:hypothetical protein
MSWKGALAAAITVLCLALLALEPGIAAAADSAGRARLPLVGLGFASCLLAVVCKAVRWRVLYPSEDSPSLGLAVTTVAIGQVANWAAPARAGDLARLALVSSRPRGGSEPRQGAPIARDAGVLVAEKVGDAAMLLISTALLLVVGVGG